MGCGQLHKTTKGKIQLRGDAGDSTCHQHNCLHKVKPFLIFQSRGDAGNSICHQHDRLHEVNSFIIFLSVNGAQDVGVRKVE